MAERQKEKGKRISNTTENTLSCSNEINNNGNLSHKNMILPNRNILYQLKQKNFKTVETEGNLSGSNKILDKIKLDFKKSLSVMKMFKNQKK